MAIITKTHAHDGIRAFTEAANYKIAHTTQSSLALARDIQRLAYMRLDDLGSSNLQITLERDIQVFYDAGTKGVTISTPHF
jgi:hypothetical protein